MDKEKLTTIIILAVCLLAIIFFFNPNFLSVSTRGSLSSCEDSRESKDDSGYWVSDCYLATESLMKCNDYWAIKADYRDGKSKSWINDQDDLGNYFLMYDDYSDWGRILYDCAEGQLVMPPYPKCVEDADCRAGEICDIRRGDDLTCIHYSTHEYKSCYNEDVYWYDTFNQITDLYQDCGESYCDAFGAGYVCGSYVCYDRNCYTKGCSGSSCYSQQTKQTITIDEAKFKEYEAKISELEGNIQAQLDYIVSLELTYQENILLIQKLELNIKGQAELINLLDLTIQEQAELIIAMELKVDEQIQLITALNLNIQQQAELINALTTNLEIKIALIKQLQAKNEEQAQLIKLMGLSFSEQAEIINALNKTITDDAEIIIALDLKVDEQAILIKELNLNIKEQAELITAMKLNIKEQAELINALKLKVGEQAELISELRLTAEQQAEIIQNLKLNAQELKELNAQLKNIIFETQKGYDYMKIVAIGSVIGFLIVLILYFRKK